MNCEKVHLTSLHYPTQNALCNSNTGKISFAPLPTLTAYDVETNISARERMTSSNSRWIFSYTRFEFVLLPNAFSTSSSTSTILLFSTASWSYMNLPITTLNVQRVMQCEQYILQSFILCQYYFSNEKRVSTVVLIRVTWALSTIFSFKMSSSLPLQEYLLDSFSQMRLLLFLSLSFQSVTEPSYWKQPTFRERTDIVSQSGFGSSTK